MDLTEDELNLLQAIVDGNRSAQPQDMRRQEGESVEDYRARLQSAQNVQPSAGSQEMTALAEEAMGLIPPEQYAAQQNIEANPVLARVGAAVKGIPFAGEWMDELRGLIRGPEDMENVRALVSQFEEQNPYETLGYQLGTGVAATVPMVLAASPYVVGGQGATLLGQTVRGGITGLLGGGAEGIVSGAGEEGDRLANSVTRGAVGAGVGAGLGLLAPPLLAGIGNLLRDPAEAAVTTGLGVSPQASRFLSRILGPDDPQIAVDAIGDAGRTAMLADTSPRATGVLDAVLQMPETPSTFARRINDRANTVMGDVTRGMDDTLGKPQGLISIEEAIRTDAAPNIRAAYNAAYTTPIDYAAPEGRKIESVLSRLPRQTALRAVSIANDRMQWNPSIARNQIMAQVADDGTVTFQEMPNVLQLDYMKRAFDTIARDGTDPVTGKMTSEAQFAREIAREIRNATREAVPVYGQALELAADEISQEAAVDFGATLLARNVTREQVQRQVKDATAPELRAMRLALRSSIDEQLANIRRTASNPNADIDGRKLQGAFNILNSEASETKIRALLGQDADVLLTEIRAAQRALGLQADTVKNSRTFGRGAVQGLLGEVSQPNIVQSIAMGQPIETTQRAIQAVTNVTPESVTAQGQAVINEIADILTRSGNVESMQALKLIRDASSARPVTEKQAYQIAEALTAAVASGAYQQGTQNLTGQLRGLLAQ